jgi:hypothetical protein
MMKWRGGGAAGCPTPAGSCCCCWVELGEDGPANSPRTRMVLCMQCIEELDEMLRHRKPGQLVVFVGDVLLKGACVCCQFARCWAQSLVVKLFDADMGTSLHQSGANGVHVVRGRSIPLSFRPSLGKRRGAIPTTATTTPQCWL